MNRKPHLRGLAIESFVIVVSILLAFSVDRLWDGHTERQALGAYVDLLEADIDTNIANLDTAITTLDRSLPRTSALVGLLEAGTGMPPEDSLRAMVQSLFAPASIQPVTAAYDASTGAGAWERLPPWIRVDLAGFSHAFSRPQEQNATNAYLRVNEITGHYGGALAYAPAEVRSYFGLSPRAPRTNIHRLLADPDLMTAATQLLINQTERLQTMREWRKRLQAIRSGLASR